MAVLAPNVVFPRVVKHSMVCLTKPAFYTVTVEECAIMNTPEGELYNTSVLERLVCCLKLYIKLNLKLIVFCGIPLERISSPPGRNVLLSFVYNSL